MTTQTLAHTWQPSARQDAVRQKIAEAPPGSVSLLGYGGAAGGAKTNLLANLAIDVALECPGSRSLVGRQDFIDLQTTTLAEFDAALPDGVLVRAYNSSPVFREIRLPDWPKGVTSTVWFRGLEDWQSLLSEEFGWVFIDEGQQVALRAVLALLTRLRHKPEPKRGLVVGFNPFPGWCVDWFMRQDFEPAIKQAFDNDPNLFLDFIPSKIGDNPHLPAGYQAMLEATLASDPYMKAIMVDGDPDAAIGGLLYFNRGSIDRAQLFCQDPIERRPTTPTPGGPADGEVLIWELPLNSARYYIGADTADGKAEAMDSMPEKGGSDRNAAAIYRADTNTQVGAIYGRQEEHVFARLLDEYGRYYNNALLAVERNRRPVIVALRDKEYPNLFTAPRTASHLTRLIPNANIANTLDYGWLTDARSRPELLAEYREAFNAYAIKPRDRELIRELMNFMAGQKPQAAPGQHDDRVFAHAIAWQARKTIRSNAPASSGLSFVGGI